MTSSIAVVLNQYIATITLSNPGKLNAMTLDMWQKLQGAIDELGERDDVRCIVLRGQGSNAFSAGADIEEFQRARSTKEQALTYGSITHQALQAVAQSRKPTLAMIEGACVGGGLELASVCDMRICGHSSRFGAPINRLGLVMSYGEIGGLIALAGHAVAMEIVLEGRIFGAVEAYEKRLINRVVDDPSVATEVYATAERIARGAPLAAMWHKRFAARLKNTHPLEQAELDEAYDCFDTEDFQIGFRAFLDKQRPSFVGR